MLCSGDLCFGLAGWFPCLLARLTGWLAGLRSKDVFFDEKLYGCSQDTHRSFLLYSGSFFSGKKWFSVPIKLDNYSYNHISQQEIGSVATIEELCICGFHLVEAVIQAEKALGFLIFLEIGTCLWSLILGIFFGVVEHL